MIRRERVDDCLEDVAFDKDQIPNFGVKKAIADVLDDIIQRDTSSSPMTTLYSKPMDSQPQQVRFLEGSDSFEDGCFIKLLGC